MSKIIKNTVIVTLIAATLIIILYSKNLLDKPTSGNDPSQQVEGYINVSLQISQNNGGTVGGGGKVKIGESFTIQATPKDNYIFEGWFIGDKLVSQEVEHSITLEESTEVIAKFALRDEYYSVVDGDYLLALVSKNTNLGEYRPTDLVELPKHTLSRPQWRYYLREEAALQLNKMWEDANSEGIILYVNSAFRDYETQVELFSNAVRRYGEEIANTRSARPGESEHQLGTAVDFVERPDGALLQSFAQTPAGQWLMENAHKYGYAMSYPEGKESVTGYIFEPWHYRYIGVEKAMEWKESGQALNEFLREQPQQLEIERLLVGNR